MANARKPKSAVAPHQGGRERQIEQASVSGRHDEAVEIIQDRLFEQLAKVGKAVANKQRLKLLELLAQTDRTVEALANEAGLSLANVSQHLQLLRGAGLVEARKSGLYVRCRLAGPEVLELIRSIRLVAGRRYGNLDRIVSGYASDAGGLEAVDCGELFKRLRRGSTIVIDVRPAEEYQAGHIPGAVCVPLAEIQKRLRDLPRSKEIVAYCRGPYCLLAHRAVEILRRGGRAARRLTDGFPEWAAAGLPVERPARLESSPL
jgi:rhodanese-related sulfurtransferase/DNA-binding transcriptional ArsR family regulator